MTSHSEGASRASVGTHAQGQLSLHCVAFTTYRALHEHGRVQSQRPCEAGKGWAEVLTMGAGQR